MAKLQQRLEQKQTLQPQQILQATILQLTTVNLEERILEELESNPILEQVEEAPEEPPESPEDDIDLDWEQEEYEPPNIFEKKEQKDMPIPQQRDFLGSLTEQLDLCDFNHQERQIAEEIIYNLDENGYLSIDLELICDRFETDMEDVTLILKKIQAFDPKGIAARNLQECLLLQIEQNEEPFVYTLLSNHFEDVANHRYDQLIKKTGCNEGELKDALNIIKH